MANTKGNAFPLWYVSNEFQVFAVDDGGTATAKSDPNFASRVAISEDGTVWALSVTPDPDGGGAKLFWSDGDGNWQEINTPDPGGVGISGYRASSCLFTDWDGNLRSMETDGTSELLYDGSSTPLIDAAYGGGMIWALKAKNPGEMSVLSYSSSQGATWQAFAGDVTPLGLSVSYQGNCYAIDNALTPRYYAKDGSETGSAGGGLDGRSLDIAFTNWCYALSIDANEEGNLIYKWVDEAGGTFKPMAVRGMSIAASYYTK